MAPLNSINIIAYNISWSDDNGSKLEISNDFLLKLKKVSFQERWHPTPSLDVRGRNIYSFESIDDTELGKAFIGMISEVVMREEIPLIDLEDGEETSIKVPEGKAEYTSSMFLILPKKQLVFMENVRGFDGKLEQYFNAFLDDLQESKKFDTLAKEINIEALPSSADPVGFQAKHPDLKSVEFALDASAFKNNYGFLNRAFSGLSPQENEEQGIVIKVELLASKRSKSLPQAQASNLMKFIKALKEDEKDIIKSAKARPMLDGRASPSYTRLLDGIIQTTITFEAEAGIQEITAKFLDACAELIEKHDL